MTVSPHAATGLPVWVNRMVQELAQSEKLLLKHWRANEAGSTWGLKRSVKRDIKENTIKSHDFHMYDT